jgi:hypothetical protein
MVLAATSWAQEIPPGTALPVILSSTINSDKVQTGQAISATIAQAVPLLSGSKLRAGSRVNGQVIQVGRSADGSSFVRIAFDRVTANGRTFPMTTSLRAIASSREVQEAQLPKHGARRGDSPANWTTVQIGDDIVYRGGGHVMHGAEIVGDPVQDGVLAVLLAVPQPGCGSSSSDRRLALWVFGSSACGVFGLGHLDISHAGNTAPIGEIVLRSSKSVRVDRGSALLLITT